LKSKLSRPAVSGSLANHEIVVIAVFLLGGRTHAIDTEDVAVKANELAPGRFIWKKYPDQINLEIIRVYLSDAKKKAKGSYLSGSGTDGWLLTESGLRFARKHIKALSSNSLARESIDLKEKRWRRGERARLLGSDAYQKFMAGGIESVLPAEAAAFFRVDDYVAPEMRRRRITRIINAFGEDSALTKAIRALAHKAEGRPL